MVSMVCKIDAASAKPSGFRPDSLNLAVRNHVKTALCAWSRCVWPSFLDTVRSTEHTVFDIKCCDFPGAAIFLGMRRAMR